MNRKLKQRLAILVVVITLLIIFLPMIFSKRAEEAELMSSSAIPTPPEQVPLEQKLKPTNLNNSKMLQQKAAYDQAIEGIKPKISTSSKMIEQLSNLEKKNSQTTETAGLNNETVQVQSINDSNSKSIDNEDELNEKISMISPKVENAAVPETAKKIEAEKAPLLKTETEMKSNSVKNPNSIQYKNNLTNSVKHELKTKALSNYKTHSKIQQTEGLKRLAKAKIHNQGWVVQLGSFREVTYANQLIKSLRDKGFSAFGYYHTVKKNKIINRVYVGPFVSQKDAMKIRGYIADKMNIRGLIVKFNPVQ